MAYEILVHASPGFINSEHFAQFRFSLNFLCFFFPKPFGFIKSKDIHLHNQSTIIKVRKFNTDKI